jgi:hypothetical protein
MRLWDRHPPWAHPAFYVLWAVTGSLGPIMLIVGLLDGHGGPLWIGVSLCCVWLLSLGADWLLVRRLRQSRPGWTPWEPKSRWLAK